MYIRTECGQEVMKRLLVDLPNGHELRPLLAPGSLSIQGVIGPQTRDKGVGGFLEEVHHRVVEGVLVLVEPARHRVAHLVKNVCVCVCVVRGRGKVARVFAFKTSFSLPTKKFL